jgi:hypothetical protein
LVINGKRLSSNAGTEKLVIISVPVTPDYSKIPYAIMLQYALERIC